MNKIQMQELIKRQLPWMLTYIARIQCREFSICKEDERLETAIHIKKAHGIGVSHE